MYLISRITIERLITLFARSLVRWIYIFFSVIYFICVFVFMIITYRVREYINL